MSKPTDALPAAAATDALPAAAATDALPAAAATEALPTAAAAPDSTGPLGPPRAAYVHIPFCAHKCGYCDFASVAGAEDQVDLYLDALEWEMSHLLGTPRAVDTVFVGGGTPTHVSPAQLDRYLGRLQHWFYPTPGREAAFEFTLEANPNTLSAEKVRILADHGVNRVSLGAQSFHPHLLTTLERTHDPASVGHAVELIRQRLENVSLDLIFGVPGQSLAEWVADLRELLALEPTHCSCYGLTYEKGTRLWRQRQEGAVTPVTEDLERAMFEHALDTLTGAGWEHYEISNYARPGRRCRHNLVYWAGQEYWGFGTGAAAYVEGVRTLNTRQLAAYLERCRAGRSPITQSERLDDESRARETVYLQLRCLEGIDRTAFCRQTGYRLDDLFGAKLALFVQQGFLADDGQRVRLTRAGLPVADSLVAAVL